MKRISFCIFMVCLFSSVYAQLPAIVLNDVNGNIVRTDTITNSGKPIIIDFFATWCKPCNRELNAIHDVYSEWQEETGVKLIAVSIDEAQDIFKVKPMVDTYGWEYDILLDPNGDFRRAIGAQMIPYTIIVDGKGKIIYQHSGYTDGEENEIYERLKKCIK